MYAKLANVKHSRIALFDNNIDFMPRVYETIVFKDSLINDLDLEFTIMRSCSRLNMGVYHNGIYNLVVQIFG